MIENKIKISVRNVWLGATIQLSVEDRGVNGIGAYFGEDGRDGITLTYQDWIKLSSAIKTMGILCPYQKKELK